MIENETVVKQSLDDTGLIGEAHATPGKHERSLWTIVVRWRGPVLNPK